MSKAEDRQKPGKRVEKRSDYDHVLSGVVELLGVARRASARVVNSLMTATYWEMGRRIVEYEQAGKRRAANGEELLTHLSGDLSKRFGWGYSVDNLERARNFTSPLPPPRNPQRRCGFPRPPASRQFPQRRCGNLTAAK